jgi:hypothetical protein
MHDLAGFVRRDDAETLRHLAERLPEPAASIAAELALEAGAAAA